MPLKLFNSFVEISFFPQSHKESQGATHLHTTHCALFGCDLFDFFNFFPWEKTRSLLCWSRFVNGRLRIRSPSQADPHSKKWFFWRYFSVCGLEGVTELPRLSPIAGMTGFEGYLRGDTILLLAILAVARVSNRQIFSLRWNGRLWWPWGGDLLLHLFGTTAPNGSGSGESALTRQIPMFLHFLHLVKMRYMRCRHTSSSSEASNSFLFQLVYSLLCGLVESPEWLQGNCITNTEGEMPVGALERFTLKNLQSFAVPKHSNVVLFGPQIQSFCLHSTFLFV